MPIIYDSYPTLMMRGFATLNAPFRHFAFLQIFMLGLKWHESTLFKAGRILSWENNMKD